MRKLLLVSAACFMLAMPVSAAIDGKVAGLNPTTHAALKTIKTRNPGSLTARDTTELKVAIMADGKVDDAERDLLEEMTQSQFRLITATLANSNPADDVKTYPTAGSAKQVLLETLNPPLDLDKSWNGGMAGWHDIIREYKKSAANEPRVINFVAGKLMVRWKESNIGNGYKPLRDEIGRLYGFSNSAGSNTNAGRTILYHSMKQVDQNEQDKVPDFLYNWVRPGGYL